MRKVCPPYLRAEFLGRTHKSKRVGHREYKQYADYAVHIECRPPAVAAAAAERGAELHTMTPPNVVVLVPTPSVGRIVCIALSVGAALINMNNSLQYIRKFE